MHNHTMLFNQVIQPGIRNIFLGKQCKKWGSGSPVSILKQSVFNACPSWGLPKYITVENILKSTDHLPFLHINLFKKQKIV